MISSTRCGSSDTPQWELSEKYWVDRYAVSPKRAISYVLECCSLQVEPPFCPCTWPTQENMRRPPRLARKARRRVPERRNSSVAPSPYWIYTRPRCARAHAIGLLMPSRPGIGAYSAPYRPRPWRECVCISDDSPKCPRACLANACMRPRRARTLPKPQPDALCCPDGALSL